MAEPIHRKTITCSHLFDRTFRAERNFHGHRCRRQQPGQPEHAGVQDQRSGLPRPGNPIAGRRPGRNPGRVSEPGSRSRSGSSTQGAIQTTPDCWTRRFRATASSSPESPGRHALHPRRQFPGGQVRQPADRHRQPVQGWTTVDPSTGKINTNGPIGNIIVPVGGLQAPVTTTTLYARSQPELFGGRRHDLRFLHS